MERLCRLDSVGPHPYDRSLFQIDKMDVVAVKGLVVARLAGQAFRPDGIAARRETFGRSGIPNDRANLGADEFRRGFVRRLVDEKIRKGIEERQSAFLPV